MKTITTKQLIETCRKFYACESAMNWLEENKNKTIEELYASCDRGDWLLWLFAKLEIDRKVLVLVLCDCAEIVLKYIPEGEDRPRVAIETARKWCRGEVTLEEVKSAASDAYAASDARAAYASGDACTTYAACVAAYASGDACTTYATACATYATACAGAGDAYKECADLIRKRISFEVLNALLTNRLNKETK